MHGRMRRQRWLTATAVAASAALLLAACGGAGDEPESTDAETNGSQPGGGDTDRELRVWAGSQTPITANFNPYAVGVLHLANGGIYETLFAFNKVADTEPVPMLATGYSWNDEGTELSVTIRDGVEWNDGEPFTVEDVVYSFTNDTGKPSYLADAVAADESTVVLSFDEPQFTNEYALMGATYMLPQHVFSEHENAEAETEEGDLLTGLVAWANADSPVGTGPYLVESTSDAAYTAVANPGYWGGEPAVKSLRYIGIDSNQSAEDLLVTGQIDWATMFVPEPDRLTDAGLGYINTPVDPTVLYTCANADLGCTGDQTDAAVRQALSVAIDRGEIADKAFVGLTGEISPTFALLGRDDHWIADGMPHAIEQAGDPDAAAAILEDAGYERGADGFFDVELTLTSVDGWTDYNNAARLIEEQAAEAGINVTAATVSWNEFADSRTSGEFELIMGGVVGTSTADPYQIYRDWISGEYTTEVGTQLEPGFWNFSRYANDDVDAAVRAAGSTDDDAVKAEAYATIQQHIVDDLPYIPLVVNASQTFFNQTDYTGWPTEEDLYVFPPAWQGPTSGLILSQLTGTE